MPDLSSSFRVKMISFFSPKEWHSVNCYGSEFISLRRMESWVNPAGIRCAVPRMCKDFKWSFMCRAALSSAPAQAAVCQKALALLSLFLQQFTGLFSFILMNVVCMPGAPLVQPQLKIFAFHQWKFNGRHQTQTFLWGTASASYIVNVHVAQSEIYR